VRNGETTLRHLLTPVHDVLADPATTEVVVQRPSEVGIEQHGEWSWRCVEAFDFQRLDAIGLLAGSLLSKPFDPAHPICMTTLPDGQRCTLCRPPVTAPGTISVTIRIPSKAVHRVRDPDFGDLMREAAIPAFAGRPDGHSRSPLDRGMPMPSCSPSTRRRTGRPSSRSRSRRRRRLRRPAAPDQARPRCCGV
jgi:hypothetical protein